MSAHDDLPRPLVEAVAAKLAEQDARAHDHGHILPWDFYADEAKEALDLVLRQLAGEGPRYTEPHHGMSWSPEALRELAARVQEVQIQ